MKRLVKNIARHPNLAIALSLAGILWTAAAQAQGTTPNTDKPGIRAVSAFPPKATGLAI